ncbi:uncharacterized protein BKA55DRAFT_523910, partial [Fusarium redolens]
FIVYCIGCIISTKEWGEDNSLVYTKGCFLSIANWIFLIISYVVCLILVRKRTQRRCYGDRSNRREHGRSGILAMTTGVSVDSELTDIKNKGLRYGM